jgi:hypothetical protein
MAFQFQEHGFPPLSPALRTLGFTEERFNPVLRAFFSVLSPWLSLFLSP